MTPELTKQFLAGFSLSGTRLPDGTIKASLGEATIKDWPKEMELGGNTYTLETVESFANGWEQAEYV